MSKARDIKAAFDIFDKDGSGKMSASELRSILKRQGSGPVFSDKEVDELLKLFDKDNDKSLNLAEFTIAWAFHGSKFRGTEIYTNDLYERRVAPWTSQIGELFASLDIDKSGFVEPAEMAKVITVVSGYAFDEEEYLSWYDSNGGQSDGKLDLKEFGWYICDLAECEEDRMEKAIESFREAIHYVQNVRQKTMTRKKK
mmetsp:Transcript_2752/g.7653  ORF Transcript_2752/g.7653 Transcript_2752/m.7653 type:complete len:198 (+) Transcript_2752:25-618(+)